MKKLFLLLVLVVFLVGCVSSPQSKQPSDIQTTPMRISATPTFTSQSTFTPTPTPTPTVDPKILKTEEANDLSEEIKEDFSDLRRELSELYDLVE